MIEERSCQQAGGRAAISSGRTKQAATVVPPVEAKCLKPVLESHAITRVNDTAAQITQFWFLKRTARRGLPLLRRLQLTSNSERAAEIARERKKYLEVRGTEDLVRVDASPACTPPAIRASST